MPSAETNEATRGEWRDLGFFYECDDASNSWRIAGTSRGLRKFARLLRDYALNSKNQSLSEHEHFGPHLSLKIAAWSHPEITSDWIAGRRKDLSTLAALIESVADRSPVGVRASLRHLLAPRSPYDLIVEVQDDGFDPAREDPQCW